MKSIFTKLTTLLLAGAVVLVGCSDFSADLREVNDRLEELTDAAATKTEVAALTATVEALSKKLNDQYATLEDLSKVDASVKALQKDLADAKKALEDALATKADKATVDAAIATLQKALTDAKAELNKALEDAKTEISGTIAGILSNIDSLESELEDLAKEVDALESDLDALESDFDNLTDRVEVLEGQLVEKAEEFAEYKKTVADELAAIKKGFDERGEELAEKFAAIEEEFEGVDATTEGLAKSIEALNDLLAERIQAVNDLLNKKVEDLENADDLLNDKVEDLENADDLLNEKVEDLEAEDAALAEALEELRAEYEEFVIIAGEDQVAILELIDEIIENAAADYEDLNDKLAALDAKLAELNAKVDEVAAALKSIVNVPTAILNGMSVVEFNTIVYVPMTENSDEVVSAETVAANVELASEVAVAYYRFNPSNFNIKKAEYSVVAENVQFLTKSASEAVATVKSVSEVDGKVKVELLRGKGAGNIFALAATLETGETIYSDYVQILDNQVTASTLEFVSKDGAEVYTNLTDAQNNLSAKIKVGETFSVADYVNITGADLADYSLQVKYTLVEGKVELSADGVITAVEEAEGTNNIVKVEVVDAEGHVVRRAYVNVRVLQLSIWYNAAATALMTAERVTFSAEAVPQWFEDLKNEENTIELLQTALELVKNQDYLSAIQILGGVPGFVTETMEFKGYGEASIMVDFTAAGYLESQLEKIGEIDTIEELAEFVKLIEDMYAVSDLKDQVDSAIGTVESFIPEGQYLTRVIYQAIEAIFGDFTFEKLLDPKNDVIMEILGEQVNVSAAIRTALDTALDVSPALKTRIQDALVEIVRTIEEEYKDMIDSDNASEELKAENRTKADAIIAAKVAAKQDAETKFDAYNAAILEDLYNTPWSKLIEILNSEEAKEIVAEYELSTAYNMLLAICDGFESFLTWDEGDYNCPDELVSCEREEIYE